MEEVGGGCLGLRRRRLTHLLVYPGQQTDGQGTGQWSGAGEGAPSSQPARPRWAFAECWAVIGSGYTWQRRKQGAHALTALTR